MTRSELIEQLVLKNPTLLAKDIKRGVKEILEQMSKTLEDGERIEVRGFGTFCLHHRKARIGRNPRTGGAVTLTAKSVPHFKPGKRFKQRIDY